MSGGGFGYSHISAARLHRLYLWGIDDGVHVTQETAPSRTSHGYDVVPHTRPLRTEDMGFLDGMPCTALESTVVDCCLLLNYRQVLMDHALRMGADLEKVRRMSAQVGGTQRRSRIASSH